MTKASSIPAQKQPQSLVPPLPSALPKSFVVHNTASTLIISASSSSYVGSTNVYSRTSALGQHICAHHQLRSPRLTGTRLTTPFTLGVLVIALKNP